MSAVAALRRRARAQPAARLFADIAKPFQTHAPSNHMNALTTAETKSILTLYANQEARRHDPAGRCD